MFIKSALTNERGRYLNGIFHKRYQDAAKFVEGKNVLDIGCGVGAGANLMAKHGAKSVVGVDYSSRAISYSKKHFTAPNLKFKKMNALSLKFKRNTFDLIICFEIIEHLPPKSHKDFVKQLSRLTSKDGICFCSTPNKLISSPNRKKPYNPYHKKEFTPDEFLNLFKNYFNKVKIRGYKNINPDFINKQKQIDKTLWYKIINQVSRYKITHEITPYIPSFLKNLFTKRDKLPQLESGDFELNNDLEASENIIIWAKNELS